MKKKNHTYFEVALLFAGSSVILFFIVFVFGNNSFNPDEEVCEEWKIPECEQDIQKYEIGSESRNIIESNCLSLGCKSWRPKNICEKEPSNEKCVCDEYETITERCFVNATYMIYTPQGNFTFVAKADSNERKCFLNLYWGDSSFADYPTKVIESNWRNHTYTPYGSGCIKSHLPPTPIKIDLNKEKCVEWTNETTITIRGFTTQCGRVASCQDRNWCEWIGENKYDKYYCVKKEPLTECEKGNPAYIWDNTWLPRLCRPKTIYDYSCEELKKEILIGDDFWVYCVPRHCFRGKGCMTCAGLNDDNTLTKSEIYDIAIEKGCDI